MKFLIAGAFFLAGLVGYFLLGNFEPQMMGNFESEGMDGILRVVFGLVLTVIGSLLGVIYRALIILKEAGKTKIDNWREFIGDILSSVDLWICLTVAPIIFALLLSSTNGVALSGYILIALQNGFFCHVVVERLRGQVSSSG